jgi:SAM-dependent methyltransferase
MSIPGTSVSDQAGAWDFARLNSALGLGRALRGLDYVRCLEFPLVYNHLDLRPGMRHLDAGARTSVFPLFVASRNEVEVHAVDLDSTVEAQGALAERMGARLKGKLVARQADLRELPYPDGHFDRVTVISVIEHVPDPGDTEGIRELARVLAPGGRLILTVPFGMTPRDFFMERTVYSETYHGEPVFFQRHYSPGTLEDRLLGPSGLRVAKRGYFGEAGFPFFNRFWVLPGWAKPIKAAYAWLGPTFASRFMGLYDSPESLTLQSPPMITANGAFAVLEKLA